MGEITLFSPIIITVHSYREGQEDPVRYLLETEAPSLL